MSTRNASSSGKRVYTNNMAAFQEMDYTHYTPHGRVPRPDSGLSSTHVLRPQGYWYRARNSVWYIIYQGKRYTHFRGKWYCESADQGRRQTQRNASEGLPLLFSDGTWFVEVSADPCVKKLHNGLRPGVSINNKNNKNNNNNNLTDKNKVVATTTKQNMGIRFSGNLHHGEITPLHSPPGSPRSTCMLGALLARRSFPSVHSNPQSCASPAFSLIPTVLESNDDSSNDRTTSLSRTPAVSVAGVPRNYHHKAPKQKTQLESPPSYDNAQREKNKPRDPPSYEEAQRQDDDEVIAAVERQVLAHEHSQAFMRTAVALASYMGKENLPILRHTALYPLETPPPHQPSLLYRPGGLSHPERRKLALAWAQACRAIDRNMEIKWMWARLRNDKTFKTMTRQHLLRLDEQRCLLEHHRRLCPRPLALGAQALVGVLTGHRYPYLTFSEVNQYWKKAKKASDEAWKLATEALTGEQRERRKYVTELVGPVLYPQKQTHEEWEKRLQFALERGWC